jgi:hypothetical protein
VVTLEGLEVCGAWWLCSEAERFAVAHLVEETVLQSRDPLDHDRVSSPALAALVSS